MQLWLGFHQGQSSRTSVGRIELRREMRSMFKSLGGLTTVKYTLSYMHWLTALPHNHIHVFTALPSNDILYNIASTSHVRLAWHC